MKMSKMRMPEMSVVRFTESDVIVASIRSFTLHKYGDGQKGNAYVDYDGNIYGTTQPGGGSFPESLYNDFNANNPGVNFSGSSDFHWGSDESGWSTQNFDWIIGQDNTDSSSSVDGTYRWSGAQFIKQ